MRAAVTVAVCSILCAAAVGAQRTDVPWGGGGCKTDADCSLGGECYIPDPGRPAGPIGTCKCDPWFTGLTCRLLNFQPPKSDQQGLCHRGFDSCVGHPRVTGVDMSQATLMLSPSAPFRCIGAKFRWKVLSRWA